MTEENYLEQLGKELSQKLGDAIWDFAKIEWLTYKYIKLLAGSDVLELVAHQSFKLRLDVLGKIVKQKDCDSTLSKSAFAVFSEARLLSDKRNTIVHNPWQVYVDLDRMDFVTEISKYTNPNHSFNVNDIESFTADAQRISTEMEKILGMLTSYSG